jgi:hypothetical protein
MVIRNLANQKPETNSPSPAHFFQKYDNTETPKTPMPQFVAKKIAYPEKKPPFADFWEFYPFYLGILLALPSEQSLSSPGLISFHGRPGGQCG